MGSPFPWFTLSPHGIQFPAHQPAPRGCKAARVPGTRGCFPGQLGVTLPPGGLRSPSASCARLPAPCPASVSSPRAAPATPNPLRDQEGLARVTRRISGAGTGSAADRRSREDTPPFGAYHRAGTHRRGIQVFAYKKVLLQDNPRVLLCPHIPIAKFIQHGQRQTVWISSSSRAPFPNEQCGLPYLARWHRPNRRPSQDGGRRGPVPGLAHLPKMAAPEAWRARSCWFCEVAAATTMEATSREAAPAKSSASGPSAPPALFELCGRAVSAHMGVLESGVWGKWRGEGPAAPGGAAGPGPGGARGEAEAWGEAQPGALEAGRPACGWERASRARQPVPVDGRAGGRMEERRGCSLPGHLRAARPGPAWGARLWGEAGPGEPRRDGRTDGPACKLRRACTLANLQTGRPGRWGDPGVGRPGRQAGPGRAGPGGRGGLARGPSATGRLQPLLSRRFPGSPAEALGVFPAVGC